MKLYEREYSEAFNSLVIQRLGGMMRMVRQSPEGAGMQTEDIKLMLLRAIDVLVQFDRDDGGRYVSELYYRPEVKRAADAAFVTLDTSRTGEGIA